MIDLLLVGVFGFAVYDGVRRGFIRSSFSLVVWGLAFLAAIALTRLLFGAYANIGFELGGIVRILIFSVALFIVAAWLVVGGRRVMSALHLHLERRPLLAFTERWLGVFPSLLRTSIGAAALLTALNLVPVWPPIRDLVSDSRIAAALVGGVEAIEPQLAGILSTGERPLFLAVIHGSEEQTLHFAEGTTPIIDVQEETQLLELINAERERAGLPRLAVDPQLTFVARLHAREMFDLGYLGHYSPVTGKPSDRLEARRIPFEVMGENVAYAPNAALAQQGFMRSTSHRANVVDRRFQLAGVGAVSAGVSGTLYCVLFVER